MIPELRHLRARLRDDPRFDPEDDAPDPPRERHRDDGGERVRDVPLRPWVRLRRPECVLRVMEKRRADG
jgi:hypothetical protein